MEELKIFQAEGEQPVVEPGAIESQVEQEVLEPQREVEPVTPERTYTHKEWLELQEQGVKSLAARDKETAQLRQALAEQGLQYQITLADIRDKQAVENGEITEAEATQRKQQRAQETSRQQVISRQMAVSLEAMREAEQYGRVLAAKDFGEKYGIDPRLLLEGPKIASPDQMEVKAVKLALEKAKLDLKTTQGVPETFDSGQVGSKGTSLDKMTPEEKIQWGLEHPQRKTK